MRISRIDRNALWVNLVLSGYIVCFNPIPTCVVYSLTLWLPWLHHLSSPTSHKPTNYVTLRPPSYNRYRYCCDRYEQRYYTTQIALYVLSSTWFLYTTISSLHYVCLKEIGRSAEHGVGDSVKDLVGILIVFFFFQRPPYILFDPLEPKKIILTLTEHNQMSTKTMSNWKLTFLGILFVSVIAYSYYVYGLQCMVYISLLNAIRDNIPTSYVCICIIYILIIHLSIISLPIISMSITVTTVTVLRKTMQYVNNEFINVVFGSLHILSWMFVNIHPLLSLALGITSQTVKPTYAVVKVPKEDKKEEKKK